LLRRTIRDSLPGSKEAPSPRANSFPGLEMCARGGGLKRRKYQVKARYQVRANALLYIVDSVHHEVADSTARTNKAVAPSVNEDAFPGWHSIYIYSIRFHLLHGNLRTMKLPTSTARTKKAVATYVCRAKPSIQSMFQFSPTNT